jgi:hypothetical protein
MGVLPAKLVKFLDVVLECLSLLRCSGWRGLHLNHRFHVIWVDCCYDICGSCRPASEPWVPIRPENDDVALLCSANLQFELNTTGFEGPCVLVQRPLGLGYDLWGDELRFDGIAQEAPKSRLHTYFTEQQKRLINMLPKKLLDRSPYHLSQHAPPSLQTQHQAVTAEGKGIRNRYCDLVLL